MGFGGFDVERDGGQGWPLGWRGRVGGRLRGLWLGRVVGMGDGGMGDGRAAGQGGGAAGDGGGGVGVDGDGLVEVGGHELGDQWDAAGSADQEHGVELVGVQLGGVQSAAQGLDGFQQLGADHVVEFATDAEDGAISTKQLAALHGVLGVRQEAGRYLLSVSELHRSVPALLEFVTGAGAGLSELRTHSATLEDVFVSMTGRRLRDE